MALGVREVADHEIRPRGLVGAHPARPPEALRLPERGFYVGNTDIEDDMTVVARVPLPTESMLDASPSLRDRLKAKVHDLEAERQTIVDAMNITAADTIRTDRRSEDLAKLREAVSNIDRAWEAATIEERKAMLRLAIDRVRVIGTGRGKTIAIDWASGV